MNGVKVLGAIVSGFAMSVGAIGLSAGEVKAQITTSESEYLATMQGVLAAEGYYTLADTYSDLNFVNNKIGLGYAICNGLDEGLTITDLVALQRDIDWSDYPSLLRAYGATALQYESVAQISVGIRSLCPRHVGTLESWISRNTSPSPQQSTNYTPYTPSIEDGMFGTLTAADPDSQINIRSTPSLSASSPHYGVVGDRVWVTRTERRDGYDWYFVGYLNNDASGWVRGDFVDLDWR